MTHTVFDPQQVGYRIRDDDVTANSTTWTYTQGTSATYTIGPTFRIRYLIQETGGSASGAGEGVFTLFASVNSGAYSQVTTASSNVRIVSSSQDTHGTNLTPAQMTGGTGTFTAGEFVSNSNTNQDISIPASGYTVVEWTVQLQSGLNDGDTVDLRVYNSSGSAFGTTYIQTPRITVSIPTVGRIYWAELEYTVSQQGQLQAPLLDDSTDTFYAPTVQLVDQFLTPPLLDDSSTDTFFGATITTGAVNLTAPLLDNSTDTFYAHTITSLVTLTAPHIDDSTDAFFGPTVTAGPTFLTPPLFVDPDTLHTPLVQGGFDLSPPLIDDSTDTFHAPTVTPGVVTLTPPLYAPSDDVLHTPTITTGPVNLTVPHIDNSTDTFFGPTIAIGAVTLEPPLIDDSTDTLSVPTVTTGVVTLTPPLIDDSTDTFFGPTITTGAVNITVPLLDDSTDAFEIHIVSQDGGPQSLVAPRIDDSTDTFFGATITTGSVNVAPGLLDDSTDTLNAPTMGYGLRPPLLSNVNTFYSFGANFGLFAPLLSSSNQLHEPTVVPGTIELLPPVITSTNVLYVPSMQNFNMGPPLIDDGGQLFGPVITRGAKVITWVEIPTNASTESWTEIDTET